MNWYKKLLKIPANIVIIGIMIYRRVFSPSVGLLRFFPLYPKNTCIFYPTCSAYAILAFKKYNFFTALQKTLNRIRRCHPHNSPSVDHP